MSKFNLIKQISTIPLNESTLLRKLLGFEYTAPSDDGKSEIEHAREEGMAADVDILERFSGEVKGAKAGTIRVVLSMPASNFSAFMAGEKSSGKAHIQALRKERDGLEIKNMALGFASEKIAKDESEDLVSIYPLKKGYTFKKMVGRANEALMMLMDVPVVLVKALEEYGHALKNDAIKLDLKKDLIDKSTDVLEKMMHHSYYVMTLTTSKARKIQSAVDAAWNDEEELIKALNPKIIYHYRSRIEKRQIQAAFDEISDGADSDSKKENRERKEADFESREDLPVPKSTRPQAKPAQQQKTTEDEYAKLIATIDALKKSDAAGKLSEQDRKKLAASISTVLTFLSTGTLDDEI